MKCVHCLCAGLAVYSNIQLSLHLPSYFCVQKRDWPALFQLNLPTHVKKGLKTEKASLAGALQCNGYHLAFVRAASKHSTPREHDPKTEQEEGKPTLMMLPYVACISERIKQACRNYNIRVVFRSGPTLLTKVIHPLPAEKQANVVYEVPCTRGKVYIGETKRHLVEACIRHFCGGKFLLRKSILLQ